MNYCLINDAWNNNITDILEKYTDNTISVKETETSDNKPKETCCNCNDLFNHMYQCNRCKNILIEQILIYCWNYIKNKVSFEISNNKNIIILVLILIIIILLNNILKK